MSKKNIIYFIGVQNLHLFLYFYVDNRYYKPYYILLYHINVYFSRKTVDFPRVFCLFQKNTQDLTKSGGFVELESDSFLQMKMVSALIYPMSGIN